MPVTQKKKTKKSGKLDTKKGQKNVQANFPTTNSAILYPIHKRISDFMERLKGIRSKKMIARICNREKKELKELYPSVNTRHSYFSKYRNAIKARYPATQVDELGRTVHKHHALKLMRLDAKESQERKTTTKINLDIRTSNVAQFDLREMIKKCRKAIQDKKDPYLVAIGLMGLTGRRPVEILKTGHFKPLNSNHVRFSGQAKTREAEGTKDNYKIPVLDDPKEIIQALEYIREKLDLKSESNERVNSVYTRKMLDSAKHFFKKVKLPEKIHLSNKSLRSMYVSASYELLGMDEKMSFNAFAARVLGHSKLDKNTANSYTYFTIKKKRNLVTYEYRDLL